jgi:hypothetical protein
MFIFVVAAYLVVPYLARFFLCVVLYALAILLFFLQVSNPNRQAGDDSFGWSERKKRK